MARGNVLRPKQVQQKLAIGHTKLYDLIRKDPTFPQKIELGPRASGFFEDELDAWLESKRSRAA